MQAELAKALSMLPLPEGDNPPEKRVVEILSECGVIRLEDVLVTDVQVSVETNKVVLELIVGN